MKLQVSMKKEEDKKKDIISAKGTLTGIPNSTSHWFVVA